MEIGIVYSNQDPGQIKLHDFLVDFIKQHGILAHLVERHEPVSEPSITIDGMPVLKFMTRTRKQIQLTKEAIARSIEERIWDL